MNCIYLNLKKAFDRAPQIPGRTEGLLYKVEGRLFERQEDENSNTDRVGGSKLERVQMGSLLATIMFLIYMNYVVERVHRYTSLFPDDAKVM